MRSRRNYKACRLCHGETELCLSHIIPHFFWKALETEIETGSHGQTQPHVLALSTGENSPHGILSKSDLLRMVGVTERLLCKGCEARFSEWEKYAREFLYGRAPGKIIKIEVGLADSVNPNPVVTGARRMKADYRPFKLFQLSLLWRVSVSQSFFCKPVHLGQFEKKLRNLLLKGDPGTQFDFPCMLTDLRLPGSSMMDFLERPNSGFLEGIQIVRMIMGGYVWWFMYDGVPKSFAFKEMFMDENGEFLVLIDDSGTIPMQFRESMMRAGRPLPKSFLDLPRSAKRKKG